MRNKLEISPKTIILVTAIFVAGWILFQIRDILVLLFIAFILMSALKPGVESLEKIQVPRYLAILIMYVLVIGFIAGFGTVVFPPLIHETIVFFNNLPTYVVQVAPFIKLNLNTFVAQIAPIGQNVARVTLGVFSNIITLFTIIVFSFYFLLERKHVRNFLKTFVGETMGDRIVRIILKVEDRLGGWLRGQLFLGLIIGMSVFLGLTIIGVNYAIPLALIAGVLEIIPIIGPIIAAIPAVLVALISSPILAVWVVVLYIIIQQIENNFIVPTVMKKTVGLPPLASLLALMIGGRLAGTVGIILAIPTLLVLQTVLQNVLTSNGTKD